MKYHDVTCQCGHPKLDHMLVNGHKALLEYSGKCLDCSCDLFELDVEYEQVVLDLIPEKGI